MQSTDSEKGSSDTHFWTFRIFIFKYGITIFHWISIFLREQEITPSSRFFSGEIFLPFQISAHQSLSLSCLQLEGSSYTSIVKFKFDINTTTREGSLRYRLHYLLHLHHIRDRAQFRKKRWGSLHRFHLLYLTTTAHRLHSDVGTSAHCRSLSARINHFPILDQLEFTSIFLSQATPSESATIQQPLISSLDQITSFCSASTLPHLHFQVSCFFFFFWFELVNTVNKKWKISISVI